MRLLDVRAVLDREEDAQGVDPEIKVLKELDDKSTSYAIVSHRWGTEVSYDEMTRLAAMDERRRNKVRERDGYQKIIRSCEQAMKDGYRWLWIDTCCIDKRSSAELSEAINSMYRWYRNSQMCYVYLNDVSESALPTQQDFSRFGKSSGWPEWFSRGWTLQELIAPKEAEFFNNRWMSIGSKQSLISTLVIITRIPEKVLSDEKALRSTDSSERPGVAQVMSWAADRRTTRVEDRAYSLLGLFNVNMPMLYGEGSKAFQRLQLEIIRVSSDHSIFAWNTKGQLGVWGSILANDPSYFQGCHDIKNMDPKEFFYGVKEYMRWNGIDMDANQFKLESLRRSFHSPQFSVFNVTNVGIQVWLPVIRDRDTPTIVFKAILPCRDRYKNLITIDLEFRGLSSYKWFRPGWIPDTYPEFRSLYLDCSQDAEESHHNLTLDDRGASYYGFTRCGTFPREITSDTLTLSQGNNLMVLVYANDSARFRFAVGFGYYLGEVWAHVICDKCPANREVWSSWADFAQRTYDILWSAPIDESYLSTPNTIKAAHLPQSIWDARIVSGNNDSGHTDVMIDVEQCPGCCTAPDECTYTSLDYELWLLWRSQGRISHLLELGGQSAWLHECRGQGITLGDYGDSSVTGELTRHGNIFEVMQELGIDPLDPAYRPVLSCVSSCEDVPYPAQIQHAVSVTSVTVGGDPLALHQPKGLSLPNSEEFALLLKALSVRLLGKHIVTTVIQCSEVYKFDHEGRRTDVGGVSESASNGDNRTVDPGTFPALCIVATPLAWQERPACSQTREQFKHIREHFYALENLPRLAGTNTQHRSENSRAVDRVINTIFGLKYLKNFIGKISFFESLPPVMETQLGSEASVGTAGESVLSVHPSKPSFHSWAVTQKFCRFQSTGEKKPHHEVAPLLLEKCKALAQELHLEKRKTRCEVACISQTLSVGLLEHIRITLLDPSDSNQRTSQVCHSDYNSVDVRSTVRDIEVLQAKLQATEDENEQRALEEDITGKILWFYWCGITSEVNQLLAGVVNYARRESEARTRQGLREMAEIIKGNPRIDLGGDTAHLQRIMLDAGAGISRHGLWLAARAAEQARLSRGFGKQHHSRHLTSCLEYRPLSAIHCSPNTGPWQWKILTRPESVQPVHEDGGVIHGIM